MATVWMPRTSWSLCHWWGSWQWTTVTLKPMIWQNGGDCDGAIHNSHCLWPLSQPHWHAQPCSRWVRQGLGLGTSHHSATNRMFPGHGDNSWLQKLNDVEAGGIKWGIQALLVQCTLQQWLGQSDADHHPGWLAWHYIGHVCWSQLRVPVSINMVPHTSPKLNLSPNDHHT